MNNYNITKFIEFMDKPETDNNKIIEYFIKFDEKYCELKEKNEITNDLMVQLFEFWYDARQTYGDDLILLLSAYWDEHPPVSITDIVGYTNEYYSHQVKEFCKKMDKIELQEFELLWTAIWNRELRTEINYSYFDWDNDSYYENGLLIPRKDRDRFKNEFKLDLAKCVYNRANIFIKFYSDRGKFDITAISFNGNGVWRCLKQEEIENEYFDKHGNYYQFNENEKLYIFDVKHTLATEGNIIYYKF